MKVERLTAVQTLAWGGRRLGDDVGLIVPFGVVGVLNLLAELSTGDLGLALSLATLLGILIASGLAHVAAYNAFADPAAAIDDPFGRVASRLLSLLGAVAIYVVAVLVGSIFLLVPGIYLAVRLSLAFPACVIGDRGAVASVRESMDAASGNLLKIFGVQITSAAVSVGVVVALALASGEPSMPDRATVAAASIPVTALVTPVVQLAVGRIYVENAEGIEFGERDDGSEAGADDEAPGTDRTPANW